MFAIFAQIWVLAFLLHHSEDMRPLSIIVLGLITVVTIQMAKNKVLPFLISVVIFCAIDLYRLPFIANHSNFYLLVSLLMLVWMGYEFFKYKGLSQDQLNQDFKSLRGVLCLSLFVVYFMAGIHKLNSDFFNPVVSCAADFFFRYPDEYHFDPKWIPQFLIDMAPVKVATLEIFGALLLLIPRLQLLGVLSFVALHSYLAPLSFFDFACICYSILMLFVPASAYDSSQKLERVQNAVNVWIWLMLLASLCAATMLDYNVTIIKQDVVQGWPFVVGSFYFMYQIYRNMKASGEGLFSRNTVNLWSSKPRWAYILPFVLLLYTNTSYLGLRTAGNTTMFSNLRTEGDVSNHFFMPQWLQVFDYQKNLYEIIEVPEEVAYWYRSMPSVGIIMTEFELARMVGEWKDLGKSVPMEVRNLRTDAIDTYDDITRSKRWNDLRPHWLMRKLMLFREIQPLDKPNECRW